MATETDGSAGTGAARAAVPLASARETARPGSAQLTRLLAWLAAAAIACSALIMIVDLGRGPQRLRAVHAPGPRRAALVARRFT